MVALANGGQVADVGAVEGGDVGWGTSAEAREERGSSGRRSFGTIVHVSVKV
jgi:hypothetical protein